jgi:hypothetical protein
MSLLHPTTLVLHPDYQHLKEFMYSLPQRFKDCEGELIHNGRNQLRTIEYEGQRFVVKAFKRPHLINQFIYGIFRPSKAKRSYEHALLMQEIGVGTPQPIGYINIRKGCLFDKSYYVCLESECKHVYQELFEKHFDYEEEVLRAVGKLTALLHNHGYAHKDYGRANILFVKKEDGIKLDLVDLNRLAIGPLDINNGCKNLERLPATPQMHRWIAEEYAKDRGFDVEECYNLMVAYRSTQPGKIDGKY